MKLIVFPRKLKKENVGKVIIGYTYKKKGGFCLCVFYFGNKAKFGRHRKIRNQLTKSKTRKTTSCQKKKKKRQERPKRKRKKKGDLGHIWRVSLVMQ